MIEIIFDLYTGPCLSPIKCGPTHDNYLKNIVQKFLPWILITDVIEYIHFWFLTEEAMFSWKKNNFEILVSKNSQNGLKRREMWFLAGVRMNVCVRVCARLSDFQLIKPR